MPDSVFAGSVPKLYETYMVPLIFEPYAKDVANRLASIQPWRILEIAAGTGAVTREVAARLPGSSVVATDLNAGMLDYAKSVVTNDNVGWKQADALALPFGDATFDAVVCQFGAMFFPDRPRAFAEARRVLNKSGVFVFSVWDRIEENEFADIVTRSIGERFPGDPPMFLARTPHGYHDRDQIQKDVRAGGFSSLEIDTVPERSRADSPRIPAIAYCHGTPLQDEITARDPSGLDEATEIAADAIRREFSAAAVDGKIQAHVITVPG
ncbi:MAG TPA: class I SAM-dependent methyltransferase [Gemmatimonadaceae bacterium]